jgi:hypothetical protein
MESRGSLLHLHEPANFPYAKTDQSSIYLPTPLLEDSLSYYPLIYAYIF